MIRGGRPWRSVLSGLCGLVLIASLAAGCSSARVGLGTTDESCYLALPTAAKAVGGHGHLEGIRKYTVSGLKGIAPRLYGFLVTQAPKTQAVCLAGYNGTFTKAMVMKPQGHAAGKLAVVVVTSPGNKLLATVLLAKLPVRFAHTHPF
ncbi:MAG TPA: hypothetical protein VMP41_05005 [Acidimicrobiales bacterium]|nr:hypothetical protein [Acidimicrobiales bacterium]